MQPVIPYDQEFAQRRQAVAEEEAALVRHFGEEAEDCQNWQRLFELSWLDELTNGTGSKLPRDEDDYIIGCWIDDNNKVISNGVSLYSDKFLYGLTKDIVKGGPVLVSSLADILEQADEIDCDQLTNTVDTISTYLSSSTLRELLGGGHVITLGSVLNSELFFQGWNESKGGSGLLICRFGIAIPGSPIIPAEVAINALKVVRRRIEARQQNMGPEITKLLSGQRLELERPPIAENYAEHAVSKLFRNITPADCHALAVKVGFVDLKRRPKGPAKPSKIWGMVETLLWHRFADQGMKSELVQAIALLYGVKIANNFTPDGPAEARLAARQATNSWLFDEKKIDEAARREFISIQYNIRLQTRQTVN